MVQATVKFKIHGEPHKFKIWHNLPETPGLSLFDAVTNWLARTDDYSARSLCDYVKSKGFKCKK